MCKDQKEATNSEEVHVVKVNNPLEEAEKNWALGKQLGLYAKNEDEVITALTKGKDVEENKDQQQTRKQRKGKRKD